MEMLEYDEDYDISSLKILQVGGAMLEDSLADKIIEEWPCTLMQVFGTAEGLLSFTSPDDDATIIARCQGTPVSPADEVKIVDENDEEVPTGVSENCYQEDLTQLMDIIWRKKLIGQALRKMGSTGRGTKPCGQKVAASAWEEELKSRLIGQEKRLCLQK